jgi:hypothetical protein
MSATDTAPNPEAPQLVPVSPRLASSAASTSPLNDRLRETFNTIVQSHRAGYHASPSAATAAAPSYSGTAAAAAAADVSYRAAVGGPSRRLARRGAPPLDLTDVPVTLVLQDGSAMEPLLQRAAAEAGTPYEPPDPSNYTYTYTASEEATLTGATSMEGVAPRRAAQPLLWRHRRYHLAASETKHNDGTLWTVITLTSGIVVLQVLPATWWQS